MMARRSSIIMQNLEIEQRTSAWEDEVWCFHFKKVFCLFVNHGSRLMVPVTHPVIQEELASAFVGRFRWGLQRFIREEKPFQRMERFEDRR